MTAMLIGSAANLIFDSTSAADFASLPRTGRGAVGAKARPAILVPIRWRKRKSGST